MVRKLMILSIGVVGFALPLLAFADSPVSDNFDTGFTNWYSYAAGFQLPSWDDGATGNCYYLGCMSEVAGSGVQYQAVNVQSSALTSGSFIVYFRSDGYTGGIVAGVCTTNDSVHCQSPATYGGLNALVSVTDGSLYNTNTWDYLYFVWGDDGSGNAEYCSMVNDDNEADCSWTDTAIPSSTQYSGVVLGTENGMDSGGSFFWDQLGDAPFFPPVLDTSTHIETVEPTSGSTITTSATTTFAVTGYINPADFTSGMTVQMTYNIGNITGCVSALPFVPCSQTQISFAATTSGAFSFSTTSPTQLVGQYNMQSSIVGAPGVNFFGVQIPLPFLTNTRTSTTTNFIVDTLTGYQEYENGTTNSISQLLASSTVDLSTCDSITQFSLTNCLSVLFTPQADVLFPMYQQFQTQFLSAFPWGYVTRFVQLVSTTNATSSLPSASLTVWMPYSGGGGPDASSTFTIDPTATLASASAALEGVDAPGTDLNWKGVLEPYVQLFIAISLMFIIIHDLIGTAHHFRNNGRSRGGKIS